MTDSSIQFELKLAVVHAKECVQSLEEALTATRKELHKAREEVKRLETRERELCGGFVSLGEIDRAKQRLEDARRYLADSNARLVVWSAQPSWSGLEDQERVVVKVTPKRIYIRKKGRQINKYYDKVTGAGNSKYDGVIDIEQTFPEGVDNFQPV